MQTHVTGRQLRGVSAWVEISAGPGMNTGQEREVNIRQVNKAL